MATNASHLSDIMSNEEEKLLACVHCGLCLEACPTYLATGNENDSPRGRLYLMRAVEQDRLSPTSAAFEGHINRCLGCRACEQVCPAGVEYGNLLEGARAIIASTKKQRGLNYRLQHFLLRHIWLRPERLRILFGMARFFRDTRLPTLLLKTGLPVRIWPRAAFALALLDGSSAATLKFTKGGDALIQEVNTASEPGRAAMLFKGCVTEGLFNRINDATQRVLNVNNFETQTPTGQACCGALHTHAGDLESARSLARRNIEAFADSGKVPIVTNAGGCGAMLCTYGHLLADDPEYSERARSFSARVQDVSQVLPDCFVPADGCHSADVTTYDSSCHLLYGQRASDSSRQMLLSTPGINYVPLQGSEVCCGGAGVYNLLEPKLSSLILREKLANIERSGAKVLATGNPGCHMQIRAGATLTGMNDLRVCHPVEILDESYRCAGLYNSVSRVEKASVEN